MKTVLITGVTGQDGSLMVDFLLKNTDAIILGATRRLSVPNHKNIAHLKNNHYVLGNHSRIIRASCNIIRK